MRCILERARTKRQVHAGAADSGRLSAVHVGDPALGKIFRAEAAGSNAPSQPPRANCSRHSRVVRCHRVQDRKSTRLNSSHMSTSYAVFCLKKKTTRTCKLVLLYPQSIQFKPRGCFGTFGWDPVHHMFYAPAIAKTTRECERKSALDYSLPS